MTGLITVVLSQPTEPTIARMRPCIPLPASLSIFCVSPYVQDWLAQNFVQDLCGQFHPCTSAQTNPTPDLTLTPTLILTLTPSQNRLGGSRSAGAVTRLRRVFWWCFSQNPGRPKRPASANKTSILHKVFGMMLLQLGLVRNGV